MTKHIALQSKLGVGLILLTLAGSALAAAPPTWEATRSAMQREAQALEDRHSELNAAFGFSGSKATLSHALKVQGLDPQAGTKAAARMYVVWRNIGPFFVEHRSHIASHTEAWPSNAQLARHEYAWMPGAAEEMQRHAATLEAGLTQLVAQHVARISLLAALSGAKSNLAATRRAMRGMGSRGVKDLVSTSEQAVKDAQARLDAASQALVSDEKALVAAAKARFIAPFLAPERRPLHPLDAVFLGGKGRDAEEDTDPVVRKMRPDVGTVVKFSEEVEALTKASKDAASIAKATQVKAASAQAIADAQREKLESVRGPIDLPEVREGMAKRGEYEARILASREAIKAIDTSTPEGYKKAEEAAHEVLALQNALPGLDAELTRLRSKAFMMTWQREAREELARLSASAQIAQEAAQSAQVNAQKSEMALRGAEGRLLGEVIRLQVDEITRFASSNLAFPTLTRIEVSRPGADGPINVLRVLTPSRDVLIESVSELQNAKSALSQAVSTLEDAWRECDSRSDAERRLPLAPNALQSVIDEVWKGTIKRLAKRAGGTNIRALRDAFSAPPKAHAIFDQGVAQRPFASGDLALALQAFNEVLSSGGAQRNLERTVGRTLTRYAFKDLAASQGQISAVARYIDYLAYLPFLSLAASALHHASSTATEASSTASDLAKGLRAAMGGRPSSEGSLRGGDPVTLTLTFANSRLRTCPEVSIGGQVLPGDTRPKRRQCVYNTDRLAPLPAGPTQVHIKPAS